MRDSAVNGVDNDCSNDKEEGHNHVWADEDETVKNDEVSCVTCHNCVVSPRFLLHSEINDASKSKNSMVQYHALGLLYRIRQHDRYDLIFYPRPCFDSAGNAKPIMWTNMMKMPIITPSYHLFCYFYFALAIVTVTVTVIVIYCCLFFSYILLHHHPYSSSDIISIM